MDQVRKQPKFIKNLNTRISTRAFILKYFIYFMFGFFNLKILFQIPFCDTDTYNLNQVLSESSLRFGQFL